MGHLHCLEVILRRIFAWQNWKRNIPFSELELGIIGFLGRWIIDVVMDKDGCQKLQSQS